MPIEKQVGIKYDTGKLRYDLIPVESVEEVVKVITYGAVKYKPNNWQHVENYKDRYYAACQRHLVEWKKGIKIDGESGLRHLAHAACCIIFILYLELKEELRKETK